MWTLAMHEDRSPQCVSVPVSERGSAWIFGDEFARIQLSDRPFVGQGTLFKAFYQPDGASLFDGEFRFQGVSRVGPVDGESEQRELDLLSAAEVAFARNELVSSGDDATEDVVESQQFAARVRLNGMVEVFVNAPGDAGRWAEVGTMQSALGDAFVGDVSVQVAVDLETLEYTSLTVTVDDLDSESFDVAGRPAGRINKVGWAPGATYAVEVGQNPEPDPCRERNGARATLTYYLARSGVQCGPFPTLPCLPILTTEPPSIVAVEANGCDGNSLPVFRVTTDGKVDGFTVGLVTDSSGFHPAAQVSDTVFDMTIGVSDGASFGIATGTFTEYVSAAENQNNEPLPPLHQC